MEEQKGMFSRMSPKAGFLAGIGSSLAIFFVIGFFVLLVLVLGGKKEVANNNIADGEVAGEEAPDAPKYASIPVSDVSRRDWARGNQDAQIAIVEFSDIECPYCQQFHNTMQQVIEAYPNEVKWVYRHLPLPTLHPNAPKDAEAAECVGEIGGQDKFWEYVDNLYDADLTGLDQLSLIAQSIGIDKQEFDSCLSSGKYGSKVSSQSSEGATAADAASYMDQDPSNDGRWGTPFSVIVYKDQKIPVPGAYPLEYLKSVIDSLLAQ